MKATLKMIGGALLGLTLAVGMIGCGQAKKPAPAKNSGKDGAKAAKDSNQKASSKVSSNTSKGTSKGSDNGGIKCDSSLDGIGWCETDNDIIVCAGGTWWLVSCPAIEANSFCGVDDIGTLDCWVAEEAQ